MNPQLTYNLDFSFFSSFFSSKNDEEEMKKEKEKKENIKKKKDEKLKTLNKSNISKKDSSQSSETAYSEEENKNSNKKEKEKDILIKKEKKKEKGKNIIEEDKKEEDIKEEKINVIKEEKQEEKKNKSGKKKKIKKEKKIKDDLSSFLVNYIKNVYLFRKKVKDLITKHKENFAIISSVNKNNLTMNIKINEEQIKKVNYIYEPILNENIFYIPRKLYKRKNLVKFSFVNKKNESIIDPKFNTEYDDGEFINVINLKKIKDKEEEREEEFQSFLETYYTLKPSQSKDERKKLSLEFIRPKKKHKTMDHKGKLLFGISKIPSNSILKQRPIQRVASKKRITFSDKNETLSYKKNE